MRADLLRAVPAGARPVVPSAGVPRLSPASKTVLRRASDSHHGDGEVGTAHVLLGMIHDGNALASRVIEGRLDVGALRTCLLTMMQAGERRAFRSTVAP